MPFMVACAIIWLHESYQISTTINMKLGCIFRLQITGVDRSWCHHDVIRGPLSLCGNDTKEIYVSDDFSTFDGKHFRCYLSNRLLKAVKIN